MNFHLRSCLSLCLLVLFSFKGTSQALKGTYTIGGQTPDFANFTDAVNALKTNGVAGKVLFRVRSGTYTERLVFTSFSGNSCDNTVTFEAESGDSTTVTLAAPNAAANYVVQLNGTDGIVFRKLSISSAYGAVISILGGSDCNQFLNNRLTGVKTNSASDTYSVIYAPVDAKPNNRNIFQHNRIENGSYGVYMVGNASAHSIGLTIEKSLLNGQSYAGISFTNYDSLRIAENEINLEDGAYGTYGIQSTNCLQNFQIVKNKVVLFRNAGNTGNLYGILVKHMGPTTANKGVVGNNTVKISSLSTSTAVGMHLEYISNVQVLHNTVSVVSSGTSSYSMSYSSGSNVVVKNNVFANPGGGYVVSCNSIPANLQSDYNDYYTTNPVLGNWSINFFDLAAWKASSGQDAHSLAVNPLFKSPSNLHVTQIDLNGKAVPLPQVTDDIDGEPRNATAPDIGADEFTPAANDAGITLFNGPVMPFLHGSQPVKVTLKNYGLQPLSSATIRWQVNGQEQTPFSYTGSIASGAASVVEIGAFNFSLGTAYNLAFYTSTANGAPDPQPANDTARAGEVYAAMNGTYTIGGASPVFASFAAAATGLNKGGITGKVTLKVRPGTYTEQFILNAFPGNGCSNTVTFESENGDSSSVILSSPNIPIAYTVQLNGASGIIFRKMTIVSTGIAVHLRNGSSCNQFLNNRLAGLKTSNPSDLFAIVSSMASDPLPMNNNVFCNNLFENGSYGISIGGASSNHSTGWVIENNVIKGQNTMGIMMQYNDSVRIAGNSVVLDSLSNYSYGIRLDGAQKGFKIVKNRIVLRNSGYIGFGLNNYGIYINRADGSTDKKGLIANNFVKVEGTVNNYGISQDYSNYLQIFNNNVSVAASASGKSYGMACNAGSNLEIKNNIFANLGSGYAVYAGSPPAALQSDYNDYYTTSAFLGYWTADRPDLAAWKTASGQDAHSLSVSPMFKPATNLHVTQVELNGKATPVAQVTDDIDGDPRHPVTPDIGADEFDAASIITDLVVDSIRVPAVAYAAKAATISWKVRNKGNLPTFSGQWIDRLYISANPDFNAGAALAYYDFAHTSLLPSDSSYLETHPVTLPAGLSGKYYIHVFTDVNKQIGEGNADAENNNGRTSASFTVQLNMPADLLITRLATPAQTSAGQKAAIQWTVKNLGDTAIQAAGWFDRIYVSTSPQFNPNLATPAGSYYHAGGLEPNSEYSNAAQVTVPVVPKGKYYVYVFADADLHATELSESNNVERSDTAIFIGIPDLQASNVTVTGMVNPGQSLKLTWTLQNTGSGTVQTASWTDRIFLSPIPIYLPNNAIWFDVKFASETIAAGASVNREIDLKMPDMVAGKYYAYVYTDFNNALYEEAGESNNVTRSASTSSITTGIPVSDIGVSDIISPRPDCGLTDTETVTVKITNYGNQSHTGFSIGYKLNNGSTVTENVGSLLLPASSLEYSFTPRINLAALGNYSLKVFTTLAADTIRSNDTTSAVVQHHPALSAPVNLLPANGAVQLGKPVKFSWSAVPNAAKYDLFVWKATDTLPETPLAAGLSQISFSYGGSALQYGLAYKWMVRATTPHCQASSAIHTIALRHLPDLAVDSIIVPIDSGRSETSFSLSWITKNKGAGSTGSVKWYEAVYIAESATDRSNDKQIAVFENISALEAGSSYTHPLYTFTIPARYQGNYYLVVKTNVFPSAEETTEANNTRIARIKIALLPPPDLRVDSLVANPSVLFSGDSVHVKWSVYNRGTGPTTASYWTDQVYFSNEPTYTSSAVLLGTFSHNGALAVGERYTNTAKFRLPPNIEGTYYIHVLTDVTDRVFEYVWEGNNTATWKNLQVAMRPHPNLTIPSLTAPGDTVSNNQSVSLQWITKNEGAGSAYPAWADQLRGTGDTANGYSNYTYVGSYTHTDGLQSLSVTGAQLTVRMPSNVTEGNYFFYGVADIYNSVFERMNEKDNLSPYSAPVYVVNPDLIPTALQVPASAKSEETFSLSWTVANAGRGMVYGSSWYDAVYLSKDTVLDYTDMQLTFASNNALLPSGSGYTKQQSVTLPRGISGAYYLIIAADAGGNGVFEKNESNNRRVAPLSVSISPWPDLQITDIKLPATDTAGTAFSFTYTVKNAGTARIDNKGWQDAFYLSPTKNINDPGRIYLVTQNNQRTLDSGQSATFTVAATLPMSTAGKYYVTGIADNAGNVYEYTAENNNGKISDTSVAVAALPGIDLYATAGQLVADAVTPGGTVSVEWSAANGASIANIIPEWEDAIYLSTNKTLDASDRLLGTWRINRSLQPGAPYKQNATITIPGDASGTLYFLLNIDRLNQQGDGRRENNTRILDPIIRDSTQLAGAGGVIIRQPAPADLVPVSFESPASVTSRQLITLSYTVKNNGTGSTNGTAWTDRVYLSNNYVLDGGDLLLESFPHTGKLAPGAQYSLAQQVTIPANVTGNYILIFKTDATDQVYERQAETNNLAFAGLLVQPQAPCDLVVAQVTPPVGVQLAGQTVTISWTVKNTGSNSTSGYFRDAVYFSTDTVWDVTDVLMGITDYTYSALSVQATATRQLAGKLINMPTGSYYVIVKTDVLNNLLEVDETNNLRVSDSTMKVDVKLLAMETPATDSLVNNEPLYYRINIPASLQGQTMLLTLQGDSVDRAVNRLYLRQGQPPAPNEYDFVSEAPFSAGQQLVVPELGGGVYYVLATGARPANGKQPIKLLARIIAFQVTSAASKKGGNTGAVTIRIDGAKFDPATAFRLQSAALGTIRPVKMQYINPSQVFATFNLLNAKLGLYDVVAVKANGDSTKLLNGFEVVSGNGSSAGNGSGSAGTGTGFVCQIINIGFEDWLETGLTHPASTRLQKPVAITIFYANNGNVDIPVPTRFFVSLSAGAPVAFSPDSLYRSNPARELALEFSEPGAPPGVLRPGASGYLKVYSVAYAEINSLEFVIVD